jgi:hypothetical protein
MTNFLQPVLCVERETFSICTGMLKDITLEFWRATFRMQCWKVPTLDNSKYSTFVLYPNICRSFFSLLTTVSLLCSLSFYLLFILLCLLVCLFVCFHLSPSFVWPLRFPCNGYRVALLRACLNEPVWLGVCVSLVNYCIMRRPFQESG